LTQIKTRKVIMDERAVRQEIMRLRSVVTEQKEQLKTMHNKALAYGVECWEAGEAQEAGNAKRLNEHNTNAQTILREMAVIAEV